MDLQQRIERLERQNRTLRLGAFTLLALWCGAILLNSPSGDARSPRLSSPEGLTAKATAAPAKSKPPAPPSRAAQEKTAEPVPNQAGGAEFEVADEGGTIQGTFIVFGSGNVFNLGGPNGHSIAQVGGNCSAPIGANTDSRGEVRKLATSAKLASPDQVLRWLAVAAPLARWCAFFRDPSPLLSAAEWLLISSTSCRTILFGEALRKERCPDGPPGRLRTQPPRPLR